MTAKWFLLPLVLVVGCRTTIRGASTIPDVGYDADRVSNLQFLRDYSETRGFSLGSPTEIQITPEGDAVLFLRSGPRSFVRDLFEFDVTTGIERRLLTAEEILQGAQEKLTPSERARRERMRSTARGIASYQLSKDGRRILVALSGRLFVILRRDRSITELTDEGGSPLDARFSPDAKKVACVRSGDLYVIDIETNQQRRLTATANANVINGLPEFVAQEEMGRFEGYWWSPDGTRIAFQQTDESGVERLHIADAFHPERTPESFAYPRPGKNNAVVRVATISVEGGDPSQLEWDFDRFPYLNTVVWRETGPLTLVVQNRQQTEQWVLTYDEGQTSPRIVHREVDSAWLNIDQGVPKWLPSNRGFLWVTERSGATELIHLGGAKQAVHGDNLALPNGASFREVISLSKSGDEVLVYGGNNPTSRGIFAISTSGDPGRIVAAPDAMHSAVFSEDHRTSVQWSESLTSKASKRVFHEGKFVGELSDASESPTIVPQVELGNGYAIIRPRNFDRQRKYPVLDAAYAGPGVNVVSGAASSYLLHQWLADQGFIVVRIDGRGTPLRGRDWERAIQNNLIDAALEDHAHALEKLFRQYDEMDRTRVGVLGWSFGGYFSAMAVMKRPDLYHAGVAGAPVCDWADYDTHYTERYLGSPTDNPEGYAANSVSTYGRDLRRPLMILHGTTDDNVYFTHALKMSDSLLRAGRRHFFVPLSNFTHMVADPVMTQQIQSAIAEFFIMHLGDRPGVR